MLDRLLLQLNVVNKPLFVAALFDAMCKFVAEAGMIKVFMVGGDVRGSWKSAPAQRFSPVHFWTRYRSGMHARRT